MKKTLLALCLFCASAPAYSQEKVQFSLKDLKSKDDLNPMAHKAVAYILSTPADTTDTSRKDAGNYLFVWMDKTQDYTFAMDYTIAKILEESKDEGYVILAGMIESVFKNKNQTDEQVKIYAVKKLIEYAADPANKVNPGPELKKMIKADKRGKLEKYLSEIK